jgi:hypothetical protein
MPRPFLLRNIYAARKTLLNKVVLQVSDFTTGMMRSHNGGIVRFDDAKHSDLEPGMLMVPMTLAELNAWLDVVTLRNTPITGTGPRIGSIGRAEAPTGPAQATGIGAQPILGPKNPSK